MLRVAALWFGSRESANGSKNGSPLGCDEEVLPLLRRVPAWKLLPVVPQLVSRLGSGAPADAELTAVLVRVALCHPHHVVPALVALANGSALAADELTAQFRPDTAKLEGAKNTLDALSQGRPRCLALVREYKALASGYLQLAWADAKPLMTAVMQQGKPAKGPHRIDALPKLKPAEIKASGGGPSLLKLGPPLQHAAVLTTEPPLVHCADADGGADLPACSAAGEGEDDAAGGRLVRVSGFHTTFTTPGGINLPKTIECRGCDGRAYPQLVKGRDDLRQDAVMQQLFTRVNGLLSRHAPARARQLALRTYRVVPLAPTAGVLEWVAGTITMGSWLVEGHAKWRPADWPQKRCRERLAAEQPQGASKRRNEQGIVGGYRDVCQHIKPVMHRWLLENWPQPATWHEQRVRYTRSFAVASMAGHVVGLGDRHPSNVLLDEHTAEAVMIDLGIAFDQGKLLPTPERVPFRLTRDVVDGFGVCAVEGTFRRCAEVAMGVLRGSAEQLLTLLEVLLHDPLYKWTLSPTLALKKQADRPALPAPGLSGEQGRQTGPAAEPSAELGGYEEHNSVDAEHALLVVRQKLNGRVGGTVLAVDAQVRQLIAQAIDERNLALMYPGWSAWL
ncbi:kinase-like domain-containing protein [Pavlovales sp. CCMP2436]|nr:kinase-like domain-containing protein [Pavlovales sp. CCMP2436]